MNAERYITEELKVYEEKILNAVGQLFVIEQRIYNELVMATTEFVTQVQHHARVIAILDSLSSFAHVAKRNNYCKPTVTEEKEIDIKKRAARRH